jgi:hypothetical protein
MNDKSFEKSDARRRSSPRKPNTFEGLPGHRPLYQAAFAAQARRTDLNDRGLADSRYALAAAARAAARALSLRGAERIILEKLASCYGGPTAGRALVWPSNAYLVAETGLDERTIRRAISSLIRFGLVIPKDNARRNRCPRYDAQGKIIDAFGFDLAPVCGRHDEFLAILTHREAAAKAVAGAAREIHANCLAIRSALEASAPYDPEMQRDILFRELDVLRTACSTHSSSVETEIFIAKLLDLRRRAEALFLALTTEEPHPCRTQADSPVAAPTALLSGKPPEMQPNPSPSAKPADTSSPSSPAAPTSVGRSRSSSPLKTSETLPASTKTPCASSSLTPGGSDFSSRARSAFPIPPTAARSLDLLTKSHSKSSGGDALNWPLPPRVGAPTPINHHEGRNCPGNPVISPAYYKKNNYDSTEGLTSPAPNERRPRWREAVDVHYGWPPSDGKRRDRVRYGVQWSALDIPLPLLQQACPDLASFGAPVRTSADIIAAGQALRPCFGASRDAWIEGVKTIGESETAQLSVYVHQLACDQLARNGPPSRDSRGMFGGLFRKFIRLSAAGQFNLASALLAMRRKRMF